MSLKYEPASEPLHISVKLLFLNWPRFRCKLHAARHNPPQVGRHRVDNQAPIIDAKIAKSDKIIDAKTAFSMLMAFSKLR